MRSAPEDLHGAHRHPEDATARADRAILVVHDPAQPDGQVQMPVAVQPARLEMLFPRRPGP